MSFKDTSHARTRLSAGHGEGAVIQCRNGAFVYVYIYIHMYTYIYVYINMYVLMHINLHRLIHRSIRPFFLSSSFGNPQDAIRERLAGLWDLVGRALGFGCLGSGLGSAPALDSCSI